MKKIALKVAYLGQDFHGFQRQPDIPTVEGELLKAFKEAHLFDNFQKSGYGIAGRTDKGVNALGNVVCFLTEKEVHINYLNDLLPLSIRILGQASVHFGFQPRYARERHYRYILPRTPFEEELDLSIMKDGAQILVGTHFFGNFSKRSERNPIRTINSLNIHQKKDYLVFDVKGESFLWNMVRKIINLLISIGRAELTPDELKEYLNPDNRVFINPMPPEGLILMDVLYDRVKFAENIYAKKIMANHMLNHYQDHQTLASTYEEMIRTLDK
jgi:tRNA pseudouridine38-40 synthase